MQTGPIVLTAVAILIGSAVVAPARPATVPTMSTVKFVRTTSGKQTRPVISASFNGHLFKMMIHSDAGFDMQLRHAQARTFGVRDLHTLNRSYGITKPGQVSAMGQSTGIMDRVEVGSIVDRAVPISIFEVPQNTLGMLGTRWIRRHRVILDYVSNRATLAPTAARAAAIRARLLAAGYTAVPMAFDEASRRYTVQATIGGITRTMTVASASATTFDPAFAVAGGIVRGPRSGTGPGPTGTQVFSYALGRPVAVKLGHWTSSATTDAQIEDQYAYSAIPRPANSAELSGGALGSPFLIAAQATIDFGSETLYVR